MRRQISIVRAHIYIYLYQNKQNNINTKYLLGTLESSSCLPFCLAEAVDFAFLYRDFRPDSKIEKFTEVA